MVAWSHLRESRSRSGRASELSKWTTFYARMKTKFGMFLDLTRGSRGSGRSRFRRLATRSIRRDPVAGASVFVGRPAWNRRGTRPEAKLPRQPRSPNARSEYDGAGDWWSRQIWKRAGIAAGSVVGILILGVLVLIAIGASKLSATAGLRRDYTWRTPGEVARLRRCHGPDLSRRVVLEGAAIWNSPRSEAQSGAGGIGGDYDALSARGPAGGDRCGAGRSWRTQPYWPIGDVSELVRGEAAVSHIRRAWQLGQIRPLLSCKPANRARSPTPGARPPKAAGGPARRPDRGRGAHGPLSTTTEDDGRPPECLDPTVPDLVRAEQPGLTFPEAPIRFCPVGVREGAPEAVVARASTASA